MINMMYLVLLAILALNVSSEVLDSFQRLRDDLKVSASEARGHGSALQASLIEEINREVEREGNRRNIGLLDTLGQIENRTRSLLTLLDHHADTLETIASFDEERMAYRRPDETEKNFSYWMGYPQEANDRRGNAAAKDLRDSLNAYFRFLHLAARMEGDPATVADPRPNPEDPGKRWEQYTFEGPVLANLATLEALRLEVLRRQQASLEKIGERVGVRQIVVDTMMAIVVPRSEIVVAGLPYEADIYTGMSARTLRPEYSSSAGRIEMLPGGLGARLTIQANPNLIPTGSNAAEQRFQATIKVPLAQGGFDTVRVQKNFTVVKPVIQVEALAVQRLYAQCANDLQVRVPNLQDQYRPIFSAEGAELILNTDTKDKIRVVPGRNTRARVKVANEYQGANFPIGNLEYSVVQTPKPDVAVLVQGQPYSGVAAVPATASFSLKLSPDADFAQLMPKDARYRIRTVKVLLKDGLQPPRVVASYNVSGQDPRGGIPISMPAEVRQARPGSRVFIQIDGIERINFRGEAIADNRFAPAELIFGLEIR